MLKPNQNYQTLIRPGKWPDKIYFTTIESEEYLESSILTALKTRFSTPDICQMILKPRYSAAFRLAYKLDEAYKILALRELIEEGHFLTRAGAYPNYYEWKDGVGLALEDFTKYNWNLLLPSLKEMYSSEELAELTTKFFDQGVSWNEITRSINCENISLDEIINLTRKEETSENEFADPPADYSEYWQILKVLLTQVSKFAKLEFIELDNNENHTTANLFLSFAPLSISAKASGYGISAGSDTIYFTDNKVDLGVIQGHFNNANHNEYKKLASSLNSDAYSEALHSLGHILLDHPNESGFHIIEEGEHWPTRCDTVLYIARLGVPPYYSWEKLTCDLADQVYQPATFMPYDIAAIQEVYGVNHDTMEAQKVYKLDSTNLAETYGYNFPPQSMFTLFNIGYNIIDTEGIKTPINFDLRYDGRGSTYQDYAFFLALNTEIHEILLHQNAEITFNHNFATKVVLAENHHTTQLKLKEFDYYQHQIAMPSINAEAFNQAFFDIKSIQHQPLTSYFNEVDVSILPNNEAIICADGYEYLLIEK